MARYTVRRILQIIPVFFLATALIFVIIRWLPGDPVRAIGGERTLPPATREALIERYDLDEPIWKQYVLYMSDVFQGDFGESYANRRQVNDIFREAIPRTAALAGLAVAIEAVIGIGLGVWSALRRDKFADHAILVSTIIMLAVPVFVMASIAQVWVGVKWGILPVSRLDDGFKSYIMPATIIAIGLTAVTARLMRGSLVETLREDYVRTAKAKGLSPKRVLGVHAMRNALIPVVTVLAIDLGALLGGTIVTESVFNIPGIGFQITRAITARDNTIVIGISVMLVIAYLVINLLVDLIYAWLDPRIRYE